LLVLLAVGVSRLMVNVSYCCYKYSLLRFAAYCIL
jgi:hypothetical protein